MAPAGGGGCCGGGASRLTCLAVCFLVVTYSLLGGFLFLALEGAAPPPGPPAGPPAPPAAARARTVERLWAITEDLNILYKENWTALAARELLEFQAALVATLPPAAPRADHEHRWTFSTSFLYALTLITTIGHGNVTPRSSVGKLVAMGYACVGIPIIMLYLATLGGALARRVRSLYWRAVGGGRVRGGKQPPPGGSAEGGTPFQRALNQTPRVFCGCPPRPPPVPAPLPLLLLLLYVLAGAGLFGVTERWSLLDGCFFSFSSLATIGFGPLRPGGGGSLSAAPDDLAVGVTCVYILVGIVVVAMCFNLIQEDLSAAVRGVAKRCGRGGRGAVRGGKPVVVDGSAGEVSS